MEGRGGRWGTGGSDNGLGNNVGDGGGGGEESC